MKGKLLFLTILSTINVYLDAQITNTAFIDSVGGEKVGKLSISGWMDAYYANSSYQNWNQTATLNYSQFGIIVYIRYGRYQPGLH